MATTLFPKLLRSAKKQVEQTKEKPHIHNPYLAARKEWDERYGDLISRARNWRAAFFVASATALLAVGGMIVIVRQARIVPYVIAVDSLGRAVASGPAERTTVADDRLKRAALNSWVADWRLVSMDGISQRKAIDRTYAMIAAGTPAQVAVSDYYRKDPPYECAAKQTVDVEVRPSFRRRRRPTKWSGLRRLGVWRALLLASRSAGRVRSPSSSIRPPTKRWHG